MTGAFKDDPPRHAWAVWYLLEMGLIKGFTKSFGITFQDRYRILGMKFCEKVDALCTRLADVQFENKDAVEFLWTLAEKANTPIYCDPPYFGTCLLYTSPSPRD